MPAERVLDRLIETLFSFFKQYPLFLLVPIQWYLGGYVYQRVLLQQYGVNISHWSKAWDPFFVWLEHPSFAVWMFAATALCMLLAYVYAPNGSGSPTKTAATEDAANNDSKDEVAVKGITPVRVSSWKSIGRLFGLLAFLAVLAVFIVVIGNGVQGWYHFFAMLFCFACFAFLVWIVFNSLILAGDGYRKMIAGSGIVLTILGTLMFPFLEIGSDPGVAGSDEADFVLKYRKTDGIHDLDNSKVLTRTTRFAFVATYEGEQIPKRSVMSNINALGQFLIGAKKQKQETDSQSSKSSLTILPRDQIVGLFPSSMREPVEGTGSQAEKQTALSISQDTIDQIVSSLKSDRSPPHHDSTSVAELSVGSIESVVKRIRALIDSQPKPVDPGSILRSLQQDTIELKRQSRQLARLEVIENRQLEIAKRIVALSGMTKEIKQATGKEKTPDNNPESVTSAIREVANSLSNLRPRLIYTDPDFGIVEVISDEIVIAGN